MENKNYNGWTNYETWVVAFWMDNEEGAQEFWREQAREQYEFYGPTGTWTRTENATYHLADLVKSEFEENRPGVVGVYADLLNAAMSEVNWDELAKHRIDVLVIEQQAAIK